MSLFIKKFVMKIPAAICHQQVRGLKVNKRFVSMSFKNIMRANRLHPSLKQRLDALNPKLQDPGLHKRINIGYSLKDNSSMQLERRNKRINASKKLELEKAAFLNKLKVDWASIGRDWADHTPSRCSHARRLADHFNIFTDLFNEYAYFHPVTKMEINFEYFNNNEYSPVYYGNLLKPHEVNKEPEVKINAKEGDLWTMLLVNPDGNLYERNAEVVHWFVGNIPGGNVKNGDVIFDYMQPVPPNGTGYHRYVFLLYKQKEEVNYSDYKTELPCHNLRERTFKNRDFYRRFENQITPSGLLWFQADYDFTISNFFHNTLNMKEPSFEYEFNKQFVPQEIDHPRSRSFYSYLDLQKDPKDLKQEVLKKRLLKVDPIQGDLEVAPFPLAELGIPNRWRPIWTYVDKKYRLMGTGKYREYYRYDSRPQMKRPHVKRAPATPWQLK